ncbi:MAG: hypothetical protein KF779_09110 [Hyphomonadaceae bacterium]|nr:hypothetical protein [Hyphomonadaceae bacterium]
MEWQDQPFAHETNVKTMNSNESPKGSIRFGEHNRDKATIRRSRTGRAICTLMAGRSEWEGTSSQLVEELKRLFPNDRRLAVQTPSGMGQVLSGLKAALSNAGLVLVETERVGHSRTRTIYLTTLDVVACAVMGANASEKLGIDTDKADRVRAESAEIERALELAIAKTIQ